MNDAFKAISDSLKGELGGIVVYSALAGLLLTDAIPNPGDALAAMNEKSLREQMENGEITSTVYRKKTINASSLYAPLWWGSVLLATFARKGDGIAKAKFAGLLVLSGALLGIALGGTKKTQPVDVSGMLNACGPEKQNTNVKNVTKRPFTKAVMQGNTLRIIN
jgi:hypothetical protein